jgi:hypothetical protein
VIITLYIKKKLSFFLKKNKEIQGKIFLAEALAKVVDGHVMTSILNANETEAETDETLVEFEKTDPTQEEIRPSVSYADTEKVIL